MSNLTALDVVGVVFNGNNSQITYLPNCSAAVGYADYSVAGARDFDLRHWDYYKVTCQYAMHASSEVLRIGWTAGSSLLAWKQFQCDCQ